MYLIIVCEKLKNKHLTPPDALVGEESRLSFGSLCWPICELLPAETAWMQQNCKIPRISEKIKPSFNRSIRIWSKLMASTRENRD